MVMSKVTFMTRDNGEKGVGITRIYWAESRNVAKVPATAPNNKDCPDQVSKIKYDKLFSSGISSKIPNQIRA